MGERILDTAQGVHDGCTQYIASHIWQCLQHFIGMGSRVGRCVGWMKLTIERCWLWVGFHVERMLVV